RRRAAEHGCVRGGDLLHPADDVVRAAAAETAEHRTSVPKPGGRAGGGGGRRAGGDLAGRDLPELGVSARRVRRRRVLRAGGALLRHRRTEPLGAVAGGGVRDDAGRARPPRVGGVRHYLRGGCEWSRFADAGAADRTGYLIRRELGGARRARQVPAALVFVTNRGHVRRPRPW